MSARRRAAVLVHGRRAGVLEETGTGTYVFVYDDGYDGSPVSLTMPTTRSEYRFDAFPPFFDGLLPEGWQLEALLRAEKLDPTDFMGQLLSVGRDTVGSVTVEPIA
ncbi:MAG: HipA N-terminal domain-containing protein [Rhodothermales bacterium]|nr:HipA N-terminal domain-containing protein [Rhodothermales bacterium]MBO6781487.1 HipA N-terminal domain-containing protein [Rhodothermales bacterium]